MRTCHLPLRLAFVISAVLLLCQLAPHRVAVAESGGGKSSGGPDSFGYEWIDQDEPGGPTSKFIDIEQSGTMLDFRDNQGDPNQDGGFDVADLVKPFSFYGVSLTQIDVATNGYISTKLNDNGRDWTNDCPIPAPPSGGGGARIYPFHDDLVARHDAFIKFFKNSPVTNIAGLKEPCTIVMWNDARRFEPRVDSFDFEVILFHKSGEIRYQYRDLYSGAGNEQTIGIQNGNASTGLNYACNTADSVTDDSAISIVDTNPAIAVVAPDGGEKWKAGSNKNIKWVFSYPSPASDVKITLLDNGTEDSVIVASTPNDGKFKWSIPSNLLGTDYTIRIEDAADGDPSDVSDQEFEITAP